MVLSGALLMNIAPLWVGCQGCYATYIKCPCNNLYYLLVLRRPKDTVVMPPSTEAKKRINELRRELITCHDPYHLLAEYSYENECLRKQVEILVRHTQQP